MAKISADNITLEISYKGFHENKIVYGFNLLFKGKPCINLEAFNNVEQIDGSFRLTDNSEGLIPAIKKALKTEMPVYWQPIQQYIQVGIYPDIFHTHLNMPSVEFIGLKKNALDEIINLEHLNTKTLDNDRFFIVFNLHAIYADQESLDYEEMWHFYGLTSTSISISLEVKRLQLKQFLNQLEHEYELFCDTFEVKYTENKKLNEEECSKIISELLALKNKIHPSGLAFGDRVNHFHYGDGIIVNIDDNVIAVRFDKGYGTKRFDIRYAPIIKLELNRRDYFKKHPFIARRYVCPCCCYPTLEGIRKGETCLICGWTNFIVVYDTLYWNFQDNHNADKVLNSFNGKYSLIEARQNFENYNSMYHPDDESYTKSILSSTEAVALKNEIIVLFELLVATRDYKAISCIWQKIEILFDKLQKFTN